MDKCKTKIYKSYDSKILEALKQKYGLSSYYIRQSINSKVKGVTPDAIVKDYKKMEIENKQTIKNLIEKTL
jgi:DNA polymerase/3'-5' exonuclease PolX